MKTWARELLPCPFCGGEASLNRVHKHWWLECSNEYCSMLLGRSFIYKEAAVTSWNTRSNSNGD